MPPHPMLAGGRRAAAVLIGGSALFAVAAMAPTGAAQSAGPAQQLEAVSALPPGNSGFVSAEGQARGTVEMRSDAGRRWAVDT